MEDRFTEEELQIAKSVDLVRVAESLGFTPKRVGNYYTLKEMDSIRIYDRSNWFRWSRQFEKGQNGGSQIDFLRVFAGMDVKSAVFWLLDFSGYRRVEDKDSLCRLKNQVEKKELEKKKSFVLPRPSDKNLYLYQYLQKERGLRKEVIDYFLKKNLIYESQDYHNIVFKGNASDGTTKFASMRGVFDRNRKPFKCDVAGNDKNYGFNVANKESTIAIVFEGAIDLLSYVDLFDDYESNKIALGMVSDAPLETFLKENPQIRTIYFCLDTDDAGRKAAQVLLKKYYELGYEVEDIPPPGAYKDYNEWLVSERLGQKCYEKVLAKL